MAALVHNGDTIFLDASTTAHAIIPYLKESPELTLLTNSIRAAMSFLDSPQIQVILRGGYGFASAGIYLGHYFAWFATAPFTMKK